MNVNSSIGLLLKIVLALWMFHIVSSSEKEVETHPHLRDSKPSEAAVA